MARRIFGILFLIAAVIVTGPMMLMSALNMGSPGGEDLTFWFVILLFLVPGSVFMLIGCLVFGVRYWKDTLGWTWIATALYGLLPCFAIFVMITSPEYSQIFESMDPEFSAIYERENINVVRPLLIAGGFFLLGVPMAGWRFKAKLGIGSPDPDGKPAKILQPGERPISVTVIAWLLLISPLFSMFSIVMLL